VALRDLFKKGGVDAPLRIQGLEELLVKRVKEGQPITLIVGGNEYCMMSKDEYQRVMLVVDALELLSRRMRDNEPKS